MRQLRPTTRRALLDALLVLPASETTAGRMAMIADWPPSLRHQVDLEGPARTVLTKMILASERWVPQPGEAESLVLLIETAQTTVIGSALHMPLTTLLPIVQQELAQAHHPTETTVPAAPEAPDLAQQQTRRPVRTDQLLLQSKVLTAVAGWIESTELNLQTRIKAGRTSAVLVEFPHGEVHLYLVYTVELPLAQVGVHKRLQRADTFRQDQTYSKVVTVFVTPSRTQALRMSDLIAAAARPPDTLHYVLGYLDQDVFRSVSAFKASNVA